MHARSHAGSVVFALVLAVTVAGAIAVVVAGRSDTSTTPPPPTSTTPDTITVSVAGTPVSLEPGATVRDALRRTGSEPPRGPLVSVLGDVIDPTAVRGKVTVNGSSAAMSTVLAPGDELALVPGGERTEDTVQHREQLRGRDVGDPQFSLATWHLTRIEVVGRTSGDVASVRYVTTGRPVAPDAVALTFDDGPNPRWTPRVLRVLQEYDVPATFFTVGYLAQLYPDLVQREIRSDMDVENHSWDHPLSPAFKDLSREDATAEMARTDRTLESIGATPTAFRPPGGSFDPELVAQAEAQGLRIVLWDVDPRDWATGATAPQIIRNVLGDVRPGAIIELHDGGGDRSATVAALPRIIRGIRKMGLDIVPLSSG
jgi:peptidoglycan-N-acetylglucosamine deacetylase